jgi:hypothetical protein
MRSWTHWHTQHTTQTSDIYNTQHKYHIWYNANITSHRHTPHNQSSNIGNRRTWYGDEQAAHGVRVMLTQPLVNAIPMEGMRIVQAGYHLVDLKFSRQTTHSTIAATHTIRSNVGYKEVKTSYFETVNHCTRWATLAYILRFKFFLQILPQANVVFFCQPAHRWAITYFLSFW